jgi:hypothetical protein
MANLALSIEPGRRALKLFPLSTIYRSRTWRLLLMGGRPSAGKQHRCEAGQEFYRRWMTSLLLHLEGDTAFDRKRQLAERDYFTASRALSHSLPENHVDLPFDD